MRYLSNVTTLEYSSESCIGCGRCIEVCPHAVFRLEDKRAAIVERDACMECGACERNCESGAIKVRAGVGCASAFINGLVTGGEPSCGCDSLEGEPSNKSA